VTNARRLARWLGRPAVLVALVTLAAPPASAQSTTCTVSSSGVNFGSYDVFSTSPDDITGSITVSCSASTSYAIALSAGSGSYGARTLTNGPQILDYNLYTDATRTTVWGDGTGGTATVSGTAASQTYTVYGSIAAGQNVSVGSYTDVVVVTLTF
jgi:spore coat protein U-like protein